MSNSAPVEEDVECLCFPGFDDSFFGASEDAERE